MIDFRDHRVANTVSIKNCRERIGQTDLDARLLLFF